MQLRIGVLLISASRHKAEHEAEKEDGESAKHDGHILMYAGGWEPHPCGDADPCNNEEAADDADRRNAVFHLDAYYAKEEESKHAPTEDTGELPPCIQDAINIH